MKEQGVPLENELDSFEEESIHIIGYDKNILSFACARFRPYNNAAKVERVAILKTLQKRWTWQNNDARY